MRPLVFVDTETTGFNTRVHEVIDIWALRVQSKTLETIAEAGGLITPTRIDEAHPKALELNHYDAKRWKDESRLWAEVWPAVKAAIDGGAIVGSNPAFDLRFIRAMCERKNTPYPQPHYQLIDVSTIARPLKHRGLVRSVSLDALCEFLGVSEAEGEAHTARGDVYRTLEVYRRLMGGMKWQRQRTASG